jgi:hypothetical protein
MKRSKDLRLQPVESACEQEGEWPWAMRAHRNGIVLPCSDYAPKYSAELEMERHVNNAVKELEHGIAALRTATSSNDRLMLIAQTVTALDRHLHGVSRNCPVRQAQVRLARDQGKHEGDFARTDHIANVNNLGGSGRKPH